VYSNNELELKYQLKDSSCSYGKSYPSYSSLDKFYKNRFRISETRQFSINYSNYRSRGHCNPGNPGIGDSCVPKGGGGGDVVVDPDDEGDTDPDGSVVVDSAAPVAEGVFGTPHTCDSVVLTCLSVGSHMAFAPGVVTSDPVDGERWRTWA
jgi:hypothetical protein